MDRGRAREAEPLLRAALDVRRARFRPGHWQIAEAQLSLGRALVALNRPDDARPLLAAGSIPPALVACISCPNGTGATRPSS